MSWAARAESPTAAAVVCCVSILACSVDVDYLARESGGPLGGFSTDAGVDSATGGASGGGAGGAANAGGANGSTGPTGGEAGAGGTGGSGGAADASGAGGLGGAVGNGGASGGMDTSGGGGGSEGGGGSGGAQGTGGAGGTNGVCPVPPGPNRDADRDGIIDVFDPDDDNDGRSDIAECWPGAQRFVNPGFELPANVGVSYATYREVPGWKSDSADGSIEVWSSGFRNVLAAEGRQFIEVHQFDPDTISQEIVTIPGSTLRWAFFHRGRQTTDTLELWIGAPGNTVLQRTFRTDNTQWVLYEGEYTVPAGQSQTRFEYRGILPYSGYGNFVDNADAEPICTVDTDRDGCVDSEDPN